MGATRFSGAVPFMGATRFSGAVPFNGDRTRNLFYLNTKDINTIIKALGITNNTFCDLEEKRRYHNLFLIAVFCKMLV